MTLYTRESYERELPPGGTINKTPEEFYDNLKRIKRMEKERGATLIFGHDYEQFQAWAAKGWIDCGPKGSAPRTPPAFEKAGPKLFIVMN